MANLIAVDIVSADKVIYNGSAVIVTVSAESGEMGIMHGHAPLLAALKPGHVIIKDLDGKEELIYVSGGFVEVQPQLVTILADVAERAEDLDTSLAEEAKEKALKKLANPDEGIDYKKAQLELAEASARLLLIERSKKSIKKYN